MEEIEKPNPLDLNALSNEELLEFYNTIEEHLKYLNNSILDAEEDSNE